MTVHDVIVAGAGPAGSTVARECAQRGLSVVVLDRAEFPRDKPCGGGVNVRTARILALDLTPVVERTIHGLQVTIRGSRGFVRRSPEPLSYLTQRRRLDAYLLEAAVTAGASLRERRAVRAVERADGTITVRAGNETFTGRSLVAADGANGPTAVLAGFPVARRKEIALEGNITPRRYPSDWFDVFGVDLGSVPGGYGWLFPKGDHVNIGVGGLASIGPTLRTRLDAMTRQYGFDPAELWGVRGHPLPVRERGAALAAGNTLIVGDAAGLLDPLTGEGIYAAVRSGQAAARALLPFVSGESADLSCYVREIESTLGAELTLARRLHRLFHLAPSLWAELVRRSPRAWHLVCHLLTGDATYGTARDQSRLVRAGLDGADLIARLGSLRFAPSVS